MRDQLIIAYLDFQMRTGQEMNDRHSTTGNLFMKSGAAINSSSEKQPVVALSTTEAEYVALSAATQEAKQIIIRHQSTTADINTHHRRQPRTIAVARNPVPHNRTKHIDIKFHYVQEALEDGIIDLIYCPTEQMIADILKKPLSSPSTI